MAWLDAVKGAIFNPDPNAPQQSPAPTTVIRAGNIQPGVPMQMSAPVNAEFVAAIRKAVLGRNTALTQLMATADKMAAIISDPSTRLKAAYASAGDGRTVKQIIEAVDVHLSDVAGEEAKFKQALEGKAAAEVAPLEQSAQHLAGQVQSAHDQIAAAQQRITDLTTSIAELSQQAQTAQSTAIAKRQELELMASNFSLAANAVRAELQGNKNAIATALT